MDSSPSHGTDSAASSVVEPACAERESLAAFFVFATEVLGIESQQKEGVLEIRFQPKAHPDWPKPYQVAVAVDRVAVEKRTRKQLGPTEGAAWLWQLACPALVARPMGQPDAVHEFSSQLFEAYQVEGGQTHLGGCHLEDVPFVRLTFSIEGNDEEVEHRFFTAEGEPVEASLLAELGLRTLRPLGDHPSVCTKAKALLMVEQARQAVAEAGDRIIGATLIGAKRAEGHVQFGIGDQCAQVAFSGWTATLTPPPFHCQASGLDTFHLAAIDDGRIVAAEAIAVCEESGRRVLACETVACSTTGKQVDRTLTTVCLHTGQPTLTSELVECTVCCQSASSAAMQGGVCLACRSLTPVATDEERVARLLKRYPALAKFRRFSGSSSPDKPGGVFRLQVSSTWRHWLLVAGPDDQMIAVATRGRLLGSWRQLPEADWAKRLG